MNFCLPRDRVESFVKGLKSGDLNPEKLARMTSAERRALLGEYVGKGAAKDVNAEFESKLLLKNQNQGIATWIKKTTGITPAARRDLLSRVAKMDKVLDPEDKQSFLADLAAHKLGATVTPEEAQHIAELSNKVQELRSNVSYADAKVNNVNDLAKYDYKPTEADIAYGQAVSDFRNYTGELKNATAKFTREDLKGANLLHVPVRAVHGLADFSKSIGASLDNSFFGRQGNTASITHPLLWARQFGKSWKNIGKSLTEKGSAHSVEDATNITLMSDPIYNQALRDGLKITGAKDVFPTSLPGKIPILGRAFKASEAAYGAGSDLLRFSIYKQQMKRAAELGVDLSEKNASRNIAKFVNSMTGGADLGSLEKVGGVANLAFYSLRFLKSNVDQLLSHPLGFGVGGFGDKVLGKEGAHVISYAQKQAAKNLVKVIGVLGGVLATAEALVPGSVDFDPRSTDFGKIRIGDTRFDISGGKASLITLAARVVTQSSKSSATGEVKPLNERDASGKLVYGGTTVQDVITNFFTGKLSPLGSVINDVATGKTFNGSAPTLAGEAGNLVTPLMVKNAMELASNPHAANIIAAMVADGLGLSTNTIPVSNIKSGIIPTNQNLKNGNLIDSITLYAQAIGTDPETAFNRIFSGQQIRRVDNGTVIVERMSLADSTAAKKAGGGNNPTMKLDHTVPLELGGSNDSSNLKLVPTSAWQSYTPVENALGKALKDGRINKDEAQKAIVSFKQGNLKAQDILDKYK